MNIHPRINQHPHSQILLAILRWLVPCRSFRMGGPIWKILSLGFNKTTENPWKTNGVRACRILKFKNPIQNLMNPIFVFAAQYIFGGEHLLMDFDLGGYDYTVGILECILYIYIIHIYIEIHINTV